MINTMFKKGDKVKVIGKCAPSGFYWNPKMCKTIGKSYTVRNISHTSHYKRYTSYRLITNADVKFDYWYTTESLQLDNEVGKQLLFPFMEEV